MPSKKHSSDIEQLLTEQTAVILEAVDERLTAQDKRLDRRFATQNKRIYGVEGKVDKAITQLDAVLKEVQAHHEEDVTARNNSAGTKINCKIMQSESKHSKRSVIHN